MKKILVILGHPGKESFNKKIANTYVDFALSSGFKVKKIFLNELNFNPILQEGYSQNLEPDLIEAQKKIKWANHLVFVYPMWWGALPALLKGFIDRTFTPGFAFKYTKGKFFHKKLLGGKTARIIVTFGGSQLLYRLIGHPGGLIMKTFVLNFSGIRPVKKLFFGKVIHLSEKRVEKILGKVKKVAKQGK